MASLSISTTLRTSEKPYLWLLERNGLEMGFGRAGSYARHAHRHFVDFIFSPWGLTLDGTSCQAVLAQPRTPFGPLECGDFFFTKFLLGGPPYSIPDKVEAPGCDHYEVAFGDLACLSGHFKFTGRYYDAVAQDLRELRIEAEGASVVAESSQGWRLEVTP